MLINWFTQKKRQAKPEQKFTIIDYNEKSSIDDDADFLNYFVTEYKNHLIDPALLKIIAQSVNREDLLLPIKKKIPTDPNMKKGRYGEVLSSKLMEEFHEYIIPVHKLRYLMSQGQSLPGTDIVAIKRNETQLTEVCYIESKLRTSRDPNALILGYQQLMKDQNYKINDIIFFVMACLYPHDIELVNLFSNYFGGHDDSMDSFRIVSISDKQNWTETATDMLINEITQTRHKITVDVLQIQNLEKNVDKLYKELDK